MEGGRADNCGFTLETSVSELMDYIRTVAAAHPDIKMGLLTNFPNWAYKDYPAYHGDVVNWGHYDQVFEAIMTALNEQELELHYVIADNPWGYASASHPSAGLDNVQSMDWLQRILDLENQVRDNALPFGLIYNSESGNSSGEAFANDIESYVPAYQDKGGAPDMRLIESWYATPESALPEDEAGTFTNAALRAQALFE